jgi:hypothetical protein
MNHRLQVNARPHPPELVAARSPTCLLPGLAAPFGTRPIGGPLPYDFGDLRRQLAATTASHRGAKAFHAYLLLRSLPAGT